MTYSLLEKLNLPSDIKKLSYDELDVLAAQTRGVILDSVSKNGGHLASSLGVVELTIALLRLCNPLTDRIIWDVSHQSYPFKVLTDRYKTFDTLRTFGGISGFSKPCESPYDAFCAGHASTSISAGLGIVSANDILGIRRKVVSVIGDGALSGGMAFEGLNNLGALGKAMVVVLNDNEMSISRNVGAMSATLSRIVTGELSLSLRKDMRTFLDNLPKRIQRLARKFEEGAISFFTPGILFEEMGLRYIGPIDGHKIKDLEKALQTAFSYDGPVLLHVATVKGKGYAPAEERPEDYHSISSFDLATGKPKKFNGDKTWTEAFGEKLTAMAEQDPRIVAITAAMKDGVGLTDFADRFPDRFFDAGIAEAHVMTFAAALAISGVKPYVVLYSSFLQRAFDQIIHDVAFQNLPVRICIDRSGLVGQDGPTHHGMFDISFLRLIPGIAMFLPKDLRELEDMMALSADFNGPVAIRYARGSAFSVSEIPYTPVVAGEPEIISDKGEYAIISAGHIFSEAWRFRNILKDNGYQASLINLRFVRPLNRERLMAHLAGKKIVFTFEENVRTGGVGEMIQLMVQSAYPGTKVCIMALPDEFVTHGTVDRLRQLCGLTAEHAWEQFVKYKDLSLK